jgi:hypothetical protein
MEPIEDVEAQRLLDLLDRAIHDTRRSRREIERSLGLGQGYLGSLFRGRIELKVWHVFRLARELNRDPLSFFFAVSPPQDARWVLTALGLDADKVLRDAAEAAKPPEKPATRGPKAEAKEEASQITTGQIEEIVLRTIREELKRRGVGEPPPPNPSV